MLEIRDLAVARGGIALLRGVNAALAGGGVLSVRGPNGSGKTTLLRAVAGLQPPLAGAVEVDPDSIAYLGHADGVKDALTVAENLEFWAGIYGTRGIDGALASFGIAPLRARRARGLSAGQRRRVGLARLAVANRPLWVMDEPTASLDAEGAALCASAMDSHAAAGGAVLFATHADPGVDARVLDVGAFRAAPAAEGRPG